MTKNDIITNVTERTGVSKLVVRVIFETIFDEIKTALINDVKIYIRGFAQIYNKRRPARQCRDIGRNLNMMKPADLRPSIKPYDSLMDSVNK